MKAYIVHTESNQRAQKDGCLVASYRSVGYAAAAMKRFKMHNGTQRFPATDYGVMTVAEWHESDVLVETYNMLDPGRNVIMIRKSQKGGCCDPATERYHSM